ncbi:hypothetical protein RclHR1_08530011 [Rhizophagus clarus]|uniref:Uncharacterized protein n=1 Tax=Rhizophagus clarus TaxID=94130 RepID=A0A2Z6SFG6_9GLOM|nr:hypothetical protein RclHR1_08530011 [Rhizophagus clarus]
MAESYQCYVESNNLNPQVWFRTITDHLVSADNDADDAFWEQTNNGGNPEVPNTTQEPPNPTKKSDNNKEEYHNKLPPEPTLQEISKEFLQKNANSLDASIHNSHMTVDRPTPIINEHNTDDTNKEINP